MASPSLRGALGLLLASAAAPAQAGPQATVDLTTRAGVELVRGAWRYRDARIREVDFRAAGPDRKPSGPPNRTWDIDPHAGAADFDDSDWQVLDPTTLDERRSTGKVCFAWYRIAVIVPDRIGGFDPTGSTVEFEIVVDDYAEVWVDGRLPRRLGQQGGSLVAGWNAPNRVVLGRGLRPGHRVQIAVFGINGPLSDPPSNYIWVRSAALHFHAPPPAAARSIERLDPRLDAIVAPGTAIETLADGFRWLEGPAVAPDGAVLFSDIPDNAVWAWRETTGARLFLSPSGYSGAAPFAGREPGSNGLTFDRSGRLVLCEHGDRRVSRLEPDGTRTVLADRFEGKRLNSPNDLVFARNGDLYFTDPPFGLPLGFDDPGRELAFSGVYRLSTSGELALLIDDLRGPNGIALSPDERTLYVSNAVRGRPVWKAYPLREGGGVGAGRVLLDATAWMASRPGTPDGFAIDARGNLFTAGPGGVYVLAPDGTHLGTLLTGVPTSNCALGPGGSELLVTAGTALLRVPLRGKPERD